MDKIDLQKITNIYESDKESRFAFETFDNTLNKKRFDLKTSYEEKKIIFIMFYGYLIDIIKPID